MRKKITNIWSSGGVIFLQKNDRIFVVLCHRISENLFSLPKGRPEKNEDYKKTAIREVKEETGIYTNIIKKITVTQHCFGVEKSTFNTISLSQNNPQINNENISFYKKTVHWYLMEYLSGEFSSHDGEFDSVEWIEINEARKKITHKNEKDVLGKVLAIFKK